MGQERWELDLDGVSQGLDRWGMGWARAATGSMGQGGFGGDGGRVGRVTRQTWAHALLATCWA